jgi:CheY-like chemotaxis protein
MFKFFKALSENRAFQKQIEFLKTEKQQLTENLKALNKELTQTRETLGKTQIHHAQELQKYVSVDTRMQKAKQAYKALRIQQQENLTELKASKAHITNLEAQIEHLNQRLNPENADKILTEQLKEKEQKIQSLDRELTETQEKYLSITQDNHKLLQQIKLLQEKTEASEPAGEAPQNKKVLIVDDSITTRTLMKKILESVGYEVYLAKDGLEGQTMIESMSLDIVVTDAEMPNMDGFELTRWIKNSSHRPETPVIMIAAMADKDFQEKALAAGASDFITKNNFQQQIFLNIIEKALSK